MKKKGFTLVELLAVIVILAIIAVIAVPIVLNVISKSKKGAAIDSAYSYVDAVEKYIVMHDMDETKYPIDLKPGEIYQVSNTMYTEASSINLIEKVYAEDSIILNDIIKIKGTKPSKGIVTISEKRKVGKAILVIDDYRVICEKGICNIDGETISSEDNSSTEPVETCEYEVGKTWDFEYNGTDGTDGSEQIFTVPCDGTYKVELWGAQGGSTSGYNGGTGGYASGEIKFDKNQILYIYVGGKGISGSTSVVGGYNGGGNVSSNITTDGSGGGATDIRVFKDRTPSSDDLKWNSEIGLKNRIIVAGGGGGAAYYSGSLRERGHGGTGGGLNGGTGTTAGQNLAGSGATQTTGTTFGSESTAHYFGGAGGGYWTGSTRWGYHEGAGGGSGFISGHKGCVAIISNQSTNPRLDTAGLTCSDNTTDIVCSYHYSNYIFMKTVLISGDESMPAYDNNEYIVGNSGNGHARITLVG